MPTTSIDSTVLFSFGPIWCDNCYYLNKIKGEWQRKYYTVLALSNDGSDAMVAVLTSQPKGLSEDPVCSLSPPRSGFYLGIVSEELPKKTWLDLENIGVVDDYTACKQMKSGSLFLSKSVLSTEVIIDVMRCLSQTGQDLTKRQRQWLDNSLETLLREN